MARASAGVLLLSLCASSAAAATRVELWTIGTGDDLFAKFGHAALCVLDEPNPEGRCYNYGTSDFRFPIALGWGVLRGSATFWVSVTSPASLIRAYQHEDRTVYVQRLELGEPATAALNDALRADLAPDKRSYRYLFFGDNCATRLRDHLDHATGGRLRAEGPAPFTDTYRQRVRRAFASAAPVLLASELFLGRVADRRPTRWEAMFLPEVLREEVAQRFGAVPEVVYQRQGPALAADPSGGVTLLLFLAGGLALFTTVGFAVRRRVPRRISLIVGGLVLGLCGVLLDSLVVASTLPELRWNELLLVFLPTDLLLCFLEGRRLRVYLALRILFLLPVPLGGSLGALAQPLWAPLALAAAGLVPAFLFEVLATSRSFTDRAERALLDPASGGDAR